jgi:hypothetical protein
METNETLLVLVIDQGSGRVLFERSQPGTGATAIVPISIAVGLKRPFSGQATIDVDVFPPRFTAAVRRHPRASLESPRPQLSPLGCIAEDLVVPGLLGHAGQLDHHVLDLGVLVE